jgi:ribosomal protein L9
VEDGGPEGPSASSTPVAARAIAALAVLRHAERAQVEIAAGEELRYRLSQTAAGVEIRARVAPDLEGVARVHLHAVADALRQRGVRLARAQVHLAPGSRDRVGR